MDITILGPVRISCSGVAVTPVARKPRQILAMLLLNYARLVPMAELTDELWGGRAPKTAQASVHTYVFQLRKKLAEATGADLETVGRRMLRTTGNGYEFVAEIERFDLWSFQWLERSGRLAMAEGDLAVAARDFREALALWRGPALADVEPGPGLRAEVAGLEQSRATMREHLVELALRLGMHRQILDEVADLLPHNRFHEGLHAQFMIALYRSGHRDRALQVYHRLREDMVREFGLEPSAKLTECYQAVLMSDPALDEMPVLPLPRDADLLAQPARAGAR